MTCIYTDLAGNQIICGELCALWLAVRCFCMYMKQARAPGPKMYGVRFACCRSIHMHEKIYCDYVWPACTVAGGHCRRVLAGFHRSGPPVTNNCVLDGNLCAQDTTTSS